jgi:hypothetical protein
MAVAVVPDLVAGRDHPPADLGVRVDGVARNEPRARQIPFSQ